MRKLFVLLLAAMAVPILLSGCGKIPELPDEGSKTMALLSEHFSTDADITYGEMGLTASIRRSPQVCTVSYSAPDTLAGMEVEFTRDAVEVTYKGLHLSYDPSGIPDGAVASLVVSSILQVVRNDGLAPVSGEEGLEVSGRVNGNAFTALLDPQTGCFAKLSIPEKDLEIVFDNFQFLK